MPVYNNLKIAIFAILSSQSIHALTLEPIEILSGSGNLLYAEMKFSNADPNAKVQASLAETQDLINLGLAHQPPGHLNFFTRKSHDGTGVIVITSSRPMVDSELNILLKIKEGNSTHIKQVKKQLNRPQTVAKTPMATHESKLQPQTVVSEKDIALNLPSTTQYSVKPSAVASSSNQSTSKVTHSAQTANLPLAINVVPLPDLNSAAQSVTQATQSANATLANTSGSSQVAVAPAHSQVAPQIEKPSDPKLQIAAKADEPLKADAIQPDQLKKDSQADKAVEKAAESKPIPEPAKTQPKAAEQNKAQNPPQRHIVQANESLWKIAANISAQTNQSIPQVMKKIQADNAHAFIGGNINRMRKGVALNLATSYNPKAKVPNVPASNQAKGAPKQSGKAKYRIAQAEMSLVAESQQDSVQGSAKEKNQSNQASSELSAKVMTAREKTVKLQKNVSKLSLALQQKDQRIQLLNARLAQLQQQLQQQQSQAKKPAH